MTLVFSLVALYLYVGVLTLRYVECVVGTNWHEALPCALAWPLYWAVWGMTAVFVRLVLGIREGDE